MQGGVSGMVGHFISAVLQTLGIRVLADVLVDFQGILISGAYLMLIWAMVAAIANYVIFGRPSRVVYLLIGPVLFYWMIMTTVEVSGTGVQFGDRKEADSEQEVKKTINEAVETYGGEDLVKVPLFYAKFDSLVSSTFQGAVSFLLDTKNREDIKGSARDRIYSRMLGARNTNRPFMKLLSVSLMGRCAKQYRLVHDLAENRLASATAGTKDFDEMTAKKLELASYQNEVIALDDDVREFLQKDMSLTVPEEPNCDDVWDFTRAASLKAAEEVFKVKDEEKKEFKLTDAEAEEILTKINEKFAPTSSPTDRMKGIEILAAFYLKNSLTESAHSAFASQLEGRQQFDRDLSPRLFGSMASFEAQGARMGTIYFIGFVPYLQGLLLFGLSISFPFFCLLLLSPTHAQSFFTWMALWVWVKSWDVGFAIVLIFREFLWETLPNAGELRTYQNYSAVDWDEPASVFNVIYQNDPLANTYTYFGIVGILMVAVPYVSAHFCRGASSVFSFSFSRVRFAMTRFQRVTANSKRVKEGKDVLQRPAERQSAAATAAMLKAQRNPGVKFGSNIPREKTADGTLPLHMAGKGKEAAFYSLESHESMVDRRYLGMLHTRPDSYAVNKGDLLINKVTNDLMEFYQGRTTGDVFGPQATPRDPSWGTHGGGSVKGTGSGDGTDADGG